MSPTAAPPCHAIAAGQAVRHRTRRDLLIGRVHHLVGARATVTWVRRANKSVVRVENLKPIAEHELVAFFHQQEAMYDRLRDEHDHDHGAECIACIAPPSRTSGENRLFLLGQAASQILAVPTCDACAIGGHRVRATHASRHGDGYRWCDEHATPGDPPLTTDTATRPSERRPHGLSCGRLQALSGY